MSRLQQFDALSPAEPVRLTPSAWAGARPEIPRTAAALLWHNFGRCQLTPVEGPCRKDLLLSQIYAAQCRKKREALTVAVALQLLPPADVQQHLCEPT